MSVLCHNCAYVGFLLLWIVELICQCGRKYQQVLLSPLPLLSTVYQCDGCLSSQGCGGSWLGCQALSAICAVSILELAANSGSSRMSEAPNLQLEMQLSILILNKIVIKLSTEYNIKNNNIDHIHNHFHEPKMVSTGTWSSVWVKSQERLLLSTDIKTIITSVASWAEVIFTSTWIQ